MPTTCVINFDNNPAKVIYSGQLLRGTVNLVLTESKNIRGVFVRIKGEAYAHWSEGSGDNRKSYTGAEDYLNEKTYVVGGEHGEMYLVAGSYHYTFQSFLPPQLPTSFEGDHGYIRYRVFVVLDIPMWPDKEFEVPFTVIKAINLNENPTLRVIGSVACCHSNPTLELPVIIGTYPILDQQTSYQAPPPTNGVIQQQPSASPNDIGFNINPSAPPLPSNAEVAPLLPSNTPPIPPYPSAPLQFPNDEPPTYEEAMQFGNQTGRDFIPKYPMFKRQTSYSNNS